MRRSAREQGVYLISLLFTAAPFGLALVSALQSGNDLRFLWMALASLLGASLVMAIGRARSRERNVLLALTAVAWVSAALLAAGDCSVPPGEGQSFGKARE